MEPSWLSASHLHTGLSVAKMDQAGNELLILMAIASTLMVALVPLIALGYQLIGQRREANRSEAVSGPEVERKKAA